MPAPGSAGALAIHRVGSSTPWRAGVAFAPAGDELCHKGVPIPKQRIGWIIITPHGIQMRENIGGYQSFFSS